MISRKRPVPAEHLSFIRKSCTAPPDTPMTFVSCPPMSITRRSSRPCRKHAPRAWQVISVTLFPAYGTATRPYPVATQGYVSGEKCAASSSARMVSAVSTLLQPVGRAESRAKDPSAASTAVFAQVEPISMPMA